MLRAGIISSAAALLASTSLATDVIVGGPQGVAFRGDPMQGEFSFLGTCGGPIQSMAVVDHDLFLGDTFGRVYRVGLFSGIVEDTFLVANDAAAMAARGQSLFVGGSDGTVLEISAVSGQVKRTMTSPEPVEAMVIAGDFIYVSGSSISIQRANLTDGLFSYFTCSCFGPVNALATDGTNLFLVDDFAALWTIRMSDGQPLSAFWITEPGEALAVIGGTVFVGDAQGDVRGFDPATGAEVNSVQAPITIAALINLPTPGCQGDLSGDGSVNLVDLSLLLSAFGHNGAGDIDGDDFTNLTDLSMLLAAFGSTCE